MMTRMSIVCYFLIVSALAHAMDASKRSDLQTIERTTDSAHYFYTIPATLTVLNQQKKEITASVNIQYIHGFYIVHLRYSGALIGIIEFAEDDEHRGLFVYTLANLSISKQGERKFSRVGTVLVNLVKEIRQQLHYTSIRLKSTEYNLYNLPQDSNLQCFYVEKMGFSPSGFSDSVGTEMIFPKR
jgi:hypothetical protein